MVIGVFGELLLWMRPFLRSRILSLVTADKAMAIPNKVVPLKTSLKKKKLMIRLIIGSIPHTKLTVLALKLARLLVYSNVPTAVIKLPRMMSRIRSFSDGMMGFIAINGRYNRDITVY